MGFLLQMAQPDFCLARKVHGQIGSCPVKIRTAVLERPGGPALEQVKVSVLDDVLCFLPSGPAPATR